MSTPETQVGTPILSAPFYVGQTELHESDLRLMLVGIMKDGSQAPLSVLEDVVFTTSNPSIVKIENRNLVAVSEGDCIITATIGDISTTAKIHVGRLTIDRLIVSKQSVVAGIGSIISINKI